MMDDQQLLSLAASLEAVAEQSLARVQRAEPGRMFGILTGATLGCLARVCRAFSVGVGPAS